MLRKPKVSATLPEHIVKAIDDHASPMERTKSEYLTLIAIAWFANGCPPVNEHDQRLRQLRSESRSAKRAS